VPKLIVTGSNGLIGSEVVAYFDQSGWQVVGVDNNMRREFFGEQGDTRWNQYRLEATCANFKHFELDVRDRQGVLQLLEHVEPDLIVHAAAQPSHDLAASRPFDDFEVNALGTLNLLQATLQYAPQATFVYISTNKVYGDRPNTIPMVELPTRWDYADLAYVNGIDESFGIDHTKHSLFGVSKASADLLVQEYGRYYGMKTCCLRGGCVTGPNHSGVELHGFLSYLIRCNVEEREYTVYGYKGKQVRDNIHAYDVARCIEMFYQRPQSAAVFNLGGGRQNTVSILEAFDRVSQLTRKRMRHHYVDNSRIGDHICYISDLTRIQDSLPGWGITKTLDNIFDEIAASWQNHLSETSV
jgi:CDP-paratose 2-epimerase